MIPLDVLINPKEIMGIPNYTVPLFFETDAIVVPKSKEYDIGNTISASIMGRYAIDGFSPTFGTYIWTDKQDAIVNLTIINPAERLYIALKARPYHVDNQYINQTLWIYVNNMSLPDPVFLTGLKVNTVYIPLPPGSMVNGTNIIRFHLPDAKKLPNGAYGMSVRSLAITETIPLDNQEEEKGLGIFEGLWATT